MTFRRDAAKCRLYRRNYPIFRRIFRNQSTRSHHTGQMPGMKKLKKQLISEIRYTPINKKTTQIFTFQYLFEDFLQNRLEKSHFRVHFL
jgi:hypothetical protein